MTIGIIGAMEKEIENLKNCMDVITVKNNVGLDFHIGTMFGNSVILVRSGVGKVNAAICSQVLIDLYAVDYIINIGVAGAISKDLRIGDIVISNDAVQHDFDTTACGDPMGYISGIDTSCFQADEELVKLAKDAVELEELTGVVGRVASGDRFVASVEEKNRIWSQFKALCCEMEGAAIAHTCYLNSLPFVIIRAISDTADSSADVNFQEFCEDSAKKASKIVSGIIQNLKQ